MIRAATSAIIFLALTAPTGPILADDPTVLPDNFKPSVHLKARTQMPAKIAPNGREASIRAQRLVKRKFHCFPDQLEPGTRCALRGFVDPAPAPDDGAELTEGDILTAVREIGLPSLKVRIQPGEETLVNVQTIFYAQPRPFRRSIDLLGFDIDLVAEPASYRWMHGDGTSAATTRPGKPFPAMDVTHRYREPHKQVRARVDVTYRVRYRVDGGAWSTLGQALLATGPAAQLEVREAAPVLTTP